MSKKLGRPAVIPDQEIREAIIAEKKHLKVGSRALCYYLNYNLGIMIVDRAIHCVLLVENLTVRDLSKGIRHAPWVCYEHEENLSAVHMDRHTSKYNGKQVCVVIR